MHKCPECKKVFEVKRYLTKHFERCHGPNAKVKEDPVGGLECSVCKKTFPRLSHLQRHQSTHFNVREFKCKHCDEAFNQKAHLNRHMLRKHEKEFLEQTGTSDVQYIGCPKCGNLFKTAYEMQYHRKTFHSRSKCHRCQQVVIGIEAQKKHEMKCRDESEKCLKCGATFSRMADLRSHQNSCHQRDQFQCLHCHLMFRQRVQLDRHFKKAHFKSEKCAKCEIVLESPSVKSKHHKDCENKEICGFCGLENPGYYHTQKTHWIRLKKPVQTTEPVTSVEETPIIEEPEPEPEPEPEESEAPKNDDDIEPFHHFFDDVDEPSTSFWENDQVENKEIMISFEILPEHGAQKFEFKGKVPKDLVEMFPELEETALVLLDDAPLGGKINVQVPVTIRDELDDENLRKLTDTVVKIN